MNITIHHYLTGAQAATGLAVLFDVFRASNTIIACLTQGAEYIIPVGDLEEAYQLKKNHRDHILLGERGGIPPEGFDGDNSPFNAGQLDLKGKKIILTTSAGSQGIVHATQVDQLIIGSFANAEAIVQYIQYQKPEQVSLIAIGNHAVDPALEDEVCAEYIKAKLSGAAINFSDLKAAMLQCDGAKRLRRLGQEQDLDFCTQLDISAIVPVFDFKRKIIKKGS